MNAERPVARAAGLSRSVSRTDVRRNVRRATLSELAMDRSVLRFFVLTFAFTGLLQLPALLVTLGAMAGPIDPWMPLAALGGFGPMVAAIVLSWRAPGGVRALFARVLIWRVGVGWYAVALLLPGAILTIGLGAWSLLSGSDVGPWAHPPENAQRIVALLVVPLVEEIGWRGFALPRMRATSGALRASVVLGALWAVWHVPMLLLAGVPVATFPLMLVFFVAGSVVFGWIFQHTRGSVLLVALAHAGAHLNNSHAALPSNTTPLVVHTIGFVIVALAVVIFDRRAFEARQ